MLVNYANLKNSVLMRAEGTRKLHTLITLNSFVIKVMRPLKFMQTQAVKKISKTNYIAHCFYSS